MTTAKGFAPKTVELAPSNDSLIAIQPTQSAPIASDFSAQWETFTARPGIAATGSALKSTAAGFKWVWRYEKENGTMQTFAAFLWDAFKAIALPLLSLLWLALNHGYEWIRKPETKTAIVARYQSAKSWLAPKFNYEREIDAQTELTPND